MQLYPRYVQVSHDAPERWWDPCAEFWFRQSDGIIDLPKGLDATNILLYLRRNYLVDMTSVMKKTDGEPEQAQKVPTKTPNQLLRDPAAVGPVEQPMEEVLETLHEALLPKTPKETKEKGDWKEICEFCGKECSPKGINTHRKYCEKNPTSAK